MRIVYRISTTVVSVVFILLTPLAASADIIHVPGDYSTIQEGVDAAFPGDTVLVAPGIYYERIAMSDGVKLLGSGADVTTINGGGGGHIVMFNLDDGAISGFTLTNSGSDPLFSAGVFTSQCSVTVTDCVITGNSRGITVSSNSHAYLARNAIVNQTGLQAVNFSHSTGAIVGNVIASNAWHGIWCRGSSPNIFNNTIVNNASFGLVVNPDSLQIISNNVITGNLMGILATGGEESPLPFLHISYNDVWNNTDADYWVEYGVIPDPIVSQPFVPSPGTGEISADPLFVSEAGGNLRLTMLSPCVDAGTPDTTGLNLSVSDIDGNWRVFDGNDDAVATIDMGAYEYNSTPVPVFFASFDVVVNDDSVMLAWLVTADEAIAGFRVYRRNLSTGRVATLPENGLIPSTETSYVDRRVQQGTSYEYTLNAVASDGSMFLSRPVIVTTRGLSTVLYQNHPNPFNPTTRIDFDLGWTAKVHLAIYDVSGKLVRTLIKRRMQPGAHSEVWDGRDNNGSTIATGVYFYRFTAGNRTLMRKAVLLK